jgi:hypothetical protein
VLRKGTAAMPPPANAIACSECDVKLRFEIPFLGTRQINEPSVHRSNEPMAAQVTTARRRVFLSFCLFVFLSFCLF